MSKKWVRSDHGGYYLIGDSDRVPTWSDYVHNWNVLILFIILVAIGIALTFLHLIGKV